MCIPSFRSSQRNMLCALQFRKRDGALLVSSK
jgi:hypothetical protein